MDAVIVEDEQQSAKEVHPVHGVLDKLDALASTFGSFAEGEIKKLVNEARALLP